MSNRTLQVAHVELDVREEPLPCPHMRPSWEMCPHCLGVNERVEDDSISPTFVNGNVR